MAESNKPSVSSSACTEWSCNVLEKERCAIRNLFVQDSRLRPRANYVRLSCSAEAAALAAGLLHLSRQHSPSVHPGSLQWPHSLHTHQPQLHLSCTLLHPIARHCNCKTSLTKPAARKGHRWHKYKSALLSGGCGNTCIRAGALTGWKLNACKFLSIITNLSCSMLICGDPWGDLLQETFFVPHASDLHL